MPKRVAIVGTAETWREAPWNDPDVTIVTLNDAHALGMPRIDVHYELHPLNRLWIYRKGTPVNMHDVPFGHYVRPEGHIEWLAAMAQQRRVWTQDAPPEGWPEARQFPRQEITETFKDLLFLDPTWGKEYIASGPAWILLNEYRQGAEEFVITGIHLATQREYVDQRPNFEYLIGYLLGRGCRITLPQRTPVCKAPHVYGYEPRLTVEKDRLAAKAHKVNQRRSQVIGDLLHSRRWSRRSARLRDELVRLDVEHREIQHQSGAIDLRDQLSRPEWRV